jgi:hypothetical protein
MFAGRNMSATHIAFSSIRVMATCAVMGEGAGTFAAYAVKYKIPFEQAWSNPGIVNQAQQQLIRQGAFLPGRKLETNLASQSVVTASSEQVQGRAVNVIDGHTRSVHGDMGVRPDLTTVGTHRWMSEQDDKNPWLQLRWEKPIAMSNISVVLDTGLHRMLTLIHIDAFQARMQWGRAQAETLKEFKLIVQDEQGEREIAHVTNNYQRIVHIRENLVNVTSLRLEVIATNGLDHARVVEIMCE